MVFDLDGVLLESEQVWNEAKRELVEERGGRWKDSAPRDMMGMSSPEWSRYLRDELGVDMDPERISAEVVARQRMLHGQRHRSLTLEPDAGPAMQLRPVIRPFLHQVRLQHVREKVVVAPPLPAVVEWHQEQVGAFQGDQGGPTPRPTGHGVAERAAQSVED